MIQMQIFNVQCLCQRVNCEDILVKFRKTLSNFTSVTSKITKGFSLLVKRILKDPIVKKGI